MINNEDGIFYIDQEHKEKVLSTLKKAYEEYEKQLANDLNTEV